MKKFFLLGILVVTMLLSRTVFAQVEIFSTGLGSKIHKIEFSEKHLTMPTIGGTFEFGHEFEGQNIRTAKSITGEVFIGTLTDVFVSKSLKNGFATEFIAKFNLDQAHRENPLGVCVGVSFGHMGLLPVVNEPDREEIISRLGHEGYDEFIEMAEHKKRITENYMDLEFGGSYELDGLKFELSYGVLHGSVGLSVKYNLRH